MSDAQADSAPYELPRIPGSAGAMIFDREGRLLILKPNYKKGWTIPGGQIDANGESPWDTCRRETREECGLEIDHGRLVCVDFLKPRPNRPGGIRFLFDCGRLGDEAVSAIAVQSSEIDAYQFVAPTEASTLLSGPVRRRVAAALAAARCVYLEDGMPVPGVDG
ncbi:MAG TPA: NUDIX hydrolase [Solirubrobacteraceae bacterium]|nr:NUDIX hydrolase [Solirubrobacteraceae bacterium]